MLRWLLTSYSPNYSWQRRFTFSQSPFLLLYIASALIRWLLSFCVNYSGCRVRLINVTQSLWHQHIQKVKYSCMVTPSKTKKRILYCLICKFASCCHDFLSCRTVNLDVLMQVGFSNWKGTRTSGTPCWRAYDYVLFYSAPPLWRSVTVLLVIEKS